MKFHFLLFFLLLLPFSGISQFRCSPCNLDCDTLIFEKEGNCPHCQMALIPILKKNNNERILQKIQKDSLEESIMHTVSYLTDVYGPRLIGTPNYYESVLWIKEQLENWGIKNIQLQSFGKNQPKIQHARQLAIEFRNILAQRKGEKLSGFIESCQESEIGVLISFGKSIKKDFDAIKAAATYDWSNGPVEGQVNRLKNIKRQMYGRAGF